MTHPHDPRVITTNDEGEFCVSHLNLTVSLADAGWFLLNPRLHEPAPEPARKRIMGRPPGPREPRGIPYAGFDGGARP